MANSRPPRDGARILSMTLPLALPGWMPWWLPLLVLVPSLLYLLAFLLMPFSVFGLKGRLEAVEARLDEVQAEIRRLALRLPEPLGDGNYDEEPPSLPRARGRSDTEAGRPPIPPAPHIPVPAATARTEVNSGRTRMPGPPATRVRAEPRLEWPQ